MKHAGILSFLAVCIHFNKRVAHTCVCMLLLGTYYSKLCQLQGYLVVSGGAVRLSDEHGKLTADLAVQPGVGWYSILFVCELVATPYRATL